MESRFVGTTANIWNKLRGYASRGALYGDGAMAYLISGWAVRVAKLPHPTLVAEGLPTVLTPLGSTPPCCRLCKKQAILSTICCKKEFSVGDLTLLQTKDQHVTLLGKKLAAPGNRSS